MHAHEEPRSEVAHRATVDRQRRAAAGSEPADLSTAAVLHLQRTAGNASVQALLDGERPSPVHEVVGSGAGSPLDSGTRALMEDRLGSDFSDVRVHTGPKAEESARSINAAAYTVGRDVVFGAGHYAPDTPTGQRTLAHELTHVVQQRSGPVDGTPGPGGIRVSDPSDRFEQAAERAAEQAIGEPTAAAQRQAEDEPEEETAQTVSAQRVSDVAQRQPAGPATAAPPKVMSWQARLTRGALGADKARELVGGSQKVFVGDRMTVSAVFPNLSSEQRSGVGFTDADDGAGRVADVNLQGWDGNKATWDVVFHHAGPLTCEFGTVWTETGNVLEFGDHSESFTVVTELQDFALTVAAAQSEIIKRFVGAHARLESAANAFRKAQADQQAALDDVAKDEKMVDDLLWGAFFAAAGGAAGGAVAGALKGIFDGWKKEIGEAAVGAFTDTAKDTAKFVARSLDKIRPAGSVGRPSTAGDSSTPPTVTTSVWGEHRAAGDNPFDFLTETASRIDSDQAMVQGQLTQLIEAAREAHAANTKAEFDEDPLEVASRGSELDRIIADLSTDQKHYLKQLWGAWLGHYSYHLGTYTTAKDDMRTEVKDELGRKVKNAVRKAAEQCGEDGDTWIREFSDPLRVRLEATAAKDNAL